MLFGSFLEVVESLTATTAAMGEITALTPVVLTLRSGALINGTVNPFAANPFEHGLMVAEKLAVVAESATGAAVAAGLGMLAGQHPAHTVADAAQAAAEPVRRRLRANVARLSRERADRN